MKIQFLVFIFISNVLSLGQVAADELGWDEGIKKIMTDGCVLGILDPAKRDFQERARQKGNANAVFPEEKIKPSIVELCACITRRASVSWSYQKFVEQPHLAQQLVSEAMSGGECKPTGMLGKSMGQQK